MAEIKEYLGLAGLSQFLTKLRTIFATAAQGEKAETAYNHATSSHAPSNAERNIIVGIKKNGTDLTPDSSRKVNVVVPTKTSELTNDSGFKTTDNNTTYTLTKSGSTITLTGSDGKKTTVTDSNTTYSNMGAATSTASGSAGLVPAPAAGAQSKFLRGDGTWQAPTNTTYSTMTGATSSAAGKAGLVPAPAAGKQTSFLRGDGTWVVPTNTDTKATQTNTTTNADYRVVLSTNANDTTETNTLRKSANFKANPSTGAFYAKGYDRIDISGQTVDLNSYTLSSGSPEIMKYIEKTNGGAANITCGTSDIPVPDQPFLLDVELIRWASATDYVTMQTFRSIGQKAYEYVRYCTSGTWSGWTTRVFTDTKYSLSSFGITATAAELNKLDGVTATATELNYVAGVTSSIQAQLNAKVNANMSNLRTYISLTQLGLSGTVTMAQIYSKMPNFSYFVVGTEGVNAISDLPETDSYGILEIIKNGRNFARLTPSLSTGAAGSIFYGTFSWSGEVKFTGWKRIIDEKRVANNLTTTASGYALDARQGKVLSDKINQLSNKSPIIVSSSEPTTQNNNEFWLKSY